MSNGIRVETFEIPWREQYAALVSTILRRYHKSRETINSDIVKYVLLNVTVQSELRQS
jgi:hypothetical protein